MHAISSSSSCLYDEKLFPLNGKTDVVPLSNEKKQQNLPKEHGWNMCGTKKKVMSIGIMERLHIFLPRERQALHFGELYELGSTLYMSFFFLLLPFYSPKTRLLFEVSFHVAQLLVLSLSSSDREVFFASIFRATMATSKF